MGILDIWNVNSDFHFEHCQITSFLVYFGTALVIVSIFITIFMNMQFGKNLLVLFGISTLSGFLAVLWYNYEHEKFPWGR